jgi:hypothetical protein
VLERIVGRTRDGVTLPNGEFHLVTFFNSEMLMLQKIRDFQVVLFNDAIVFLYHSSDDLTLDERSAISEELSTTFLLDLRVHFREISTSYWRGIWKRREWDRVDIDYDAAWSESEVISVLPESAASISSP